MPARNKPCRKYNRLRRSRRRPGGRLCSGRPLPYRGADVWAAGGEKQGKRNCMQRSWLIGGVAAIGIAFAGVAVADPAPTSNDNAVVAQAVVGGDYSYVGLNQGLGHANVYGGDIGGIVPFSDSFSGQV